MIEVVHTDEFEAWYLDLDDGDADTVAVAVERLWEQYLQEQGGQEH